jgi:hypothetical protein
MTSGLDRIVSLTFGLGGNESNYLGNGWSGDEPASRWMIGQSSEVWLEHPGPGRDLILELEVGVLDKPEDQPGHRLLVGVRNTGIAQIGLARGGTVGFHIPAALVDAPGPLRLRFVHPDYRRPADVPDGADKRELAVLVKSLNLYRVLPRPPAAPGPVVARDQMIMRFESLGDNCEFGLVQRRLGAEPLGLLRFSFIELPLLWLALRGGFAGLGDPDTIDVSVMGDDREYIVKESVYGMTYHTFQYEHQLSLAAARQQQITRLNFLKRKLMEDVAAAEKIFVIKRFPPLRPEEVLPIYTALNQARPGWLLWMMPSDAEHLPGTVEMLLPGLLRGYVDRFAPSEDAHDLSIEAWISVCEAASRLAGI